MKTPENGSLEYDCFLKRGPAHFQWLLLLVSGRVLPRYIWIKVSPIRDPYKPTIVEWKFVGHLPCLRAKVPAMDSGQHSLACFGEADR